LETAAEKRNPDQAAQFYANNFARVMAIRPGGKGKSARQISHGRRRRGVPGVPSSSHYNGRLYTFQNGGIVFCRAAKTGELVYSGRLGAPDYYYSSPVAADNKVYIASEEGVAVVLCPFGDGSSLERVASTNSSRRWRLGWRKSPITSSLAFRQIA
jgi:outer membrane protein assembly factor BamB